MNAKQFLLGATVALAATLTGTAAEAQSYPTRTITVIIPFAGGSASDVVARIMLDKMSRNMGQAIIVENRPGAGGNSGTGAGAKAAPDGYTLIGGGSGPVAANLALYKNLGYDPEKDIEMISPFAGFTTLSQIDQLSHRLVEADPILGRCWDHLRRHPVPRGQSILFSRGWIARDHGEAPSPVQAAVWLDTKRSHTSS